MSQKREKERKHFLEESEKKRDVEFKICAKMFFLLFLLFFFPSFPSAMPLIEFSERKPLSSSDYFENNIRFRFLKLLVKNFKFPSSN